MMCCSLEKGITVTNEEMTKWVATTQMSSQQSSYHASHGLKHKDNERNNTSFK